VPRRIQNHHIGAARRRPASRPAGSDSLQASAVRRLSCSVSAARTRSPGRALELRLGPLDQLQEPVPMPVPNRRHSARVTELILGVLSHRLQQAVRCSPLCSSTCTSDLSTRWDRTSSTFVAVQAWDVDGQRCQARGLRRQPRRLRASSHPRKTARRRSRMRSASVSRLKLQSIAARSVCWRGNCGPTATGQQPKAIIQPGSESARLPARFTRARLTRSPGNASSW